MPNILKDLNYYLNLDWTLIHGTDLDFNEKIYSYIEIEELPEFVFCAVNKQVALDNYKKQLALYLQIRLEDDEKIHEPGEIMEEEEF